MRLIEKQKQDLKISSRNRDKMGLRFDNGGAITLHTALGRRRGGKVSEIK